MSNKLTFEFSFDEVFEGIKQGVIRELSEMNFDDASNAVMREIKDEVKREIALSWGDKSRLKDEIKAEIKEKVYDELIKEARAQHVARFDEYAQRQLRQNPEELKDLRKQIVRETTDELYRDLYAGIRKDVSKQIEKVLDVVGGRSVKVQGSDHVITKEEYDELYESHSKLCALEAWGVDNWEGYDDAMSHIDD
jgi:hypothetical protein